MRWTPHVACMREMRSSYNIFVAKSLRKIRAPLWSFTRRWEGNIKIFRKDIWCEEIDWVHLAQNRIQWRVLANMAGNFLISWAIFKILNKDSVPGELVKQTCNFMQKVWFYHSRVHKNPSLDPILRHMNLVRNLMTCFF